MVVRQGFQLQGLPDVACQQPVRSDRPRGHRGSGPRRRHRLLPRDLRDTQRARGDQRGARRSGGDAGGRRRHDPDSAARPALCGFHHCEVPRPQRARRAAARLHRGGHRGGLRDAARARAAPALRRAAARHVRQPGELHPPQRCRRRARRARPALPYRPVTSAAMDEIRDAILSGDYAAVAGLTVPDSYQAVVVRADEVDMFAGLTSRDKDPRKSLHVQHVPTPELGPGEAMVAVMASAINYNTVWTSIFEPVPTFAFLKRYGAYSSLTRKHDQPFHAVGSDLAGVVLRVGPGVTKWQPGDEVVAHCLSVELENPAGHDDTMMDPQQRIWGFETNYGGLAELALVKANQLMPKPAHLTWEEAAAPGLVNSTAYRQLVSHNGANMKQGDVVLIWGASGGLGSYATQMAVNGGAIPVCVVGSPEKADIVRSMGAELVIDRSAEGYRFWKDPDTQDPKEWQRLGAKIRELTGGDDADIVFEHPGRETFGASVYVAKKGGTIVTCASTSGFLHQYDNRYLWMNLKRIVGSHFANYREAWEANRLIDRGLIHPTLSRTYGLEEVGQAALDVHHNLHQGKVGVLCLAPEEGLGVRNEELRATHLDQINAFRGH